MEIEFKIVLPDEASFTKILQRLEALGSGASTTCSQTNHFFDTEDLALRTRKLALRLREENARFMVAAKGGGKRGADDALVSRAEVESEVSASLADDILAGKASALEALIDGQAREVHELLRHMRDAVADRGLAHLGSFQNERTRPGVITIEADGAPLALQFELDRTTFPGMKIERELELEIDEPGHASAVEHWLRKLLEQQGIAWITAPSKAQRFFAALSRQPDDPDRKSAGST